MLERKWWKEKVAYQIYPKSFMDSNDDGIGDIQGIISKLDYLQKLGIDLIWLNPIYQSGVADNGYDVVDYYEIMKQFGSNEDFDNLVQEANKRGIGIMMDLVLNHTSNMHKWFLEAINNPNSKYRDYYIIRKGNNHTPPNNWRSVFGGSIWEEIGNSNEFYFHTFSKEQPDLNWENPEVRQELYNMINWWINRGVKAFRLDAINCIKKSNFLQNGTPDATDGLCNCFQYIREVDGVEEYYKELRQNTFDKYNCLTVTEAVGVEKEKLGNYIGENGNFSMMFNFDITYIDVINEDWFKRTEWTKKEFKEKFIGSQLNIKNLGWQAQFIENHDQPRAVNKYIRDENQINYYSKTMLGVMYFSVKGTPFIYQGQEIGMENFKRKRIEEFDDINSISQYKRAIKEGYTSKQALEFINKRSRDNARTPMQWSDKANAGFSNVKPWIKMNENYKNINLEKDQKSEKSIFNFYKQMIELRKNSKYSDTIIYGDFEEIKIEDDEIIAYRRKNENYDLKIICNFSNEEKNINLKYEKVVLNNYNEVSNILKPYQAIIVL